MVLLEPPLEDSFPFQPITSVPSENVTPAFFYLFFICVCVCICWKKQIWPASVSQKKFWCMLRQKLGHSNLQQQGSPRGPLPPMQSIGKNGSQDTPGTLPGSSAAEAEAQRGPPAPGLALPHLLLHFLWWVCWSKVCDGCCRALECFGEKKSLNQRMCPGMCMLLSPIPVVGKCLIKT